MLASMSVVRAIVLAAILSIPGWATTIILTGVDSSLGMQQSLYFDQDGVATQEYWAGGINVLVNGFARLVFCVDLFTNIGLNTTYGTQLDFSDTPQLKRVGWLLQNELPLITTQAGGAALQLAIWDIVTDNGDGFGVGKGRIYQSTSGAHPTDPTVLATAISLESLSVGKSSNYGIVYHNVTLSNGTTVQTLMGISINDGGPEPVPEPAPLILVLAGGGLIFLGGRRARNSDKIKAHGERSDIRSEELAGDARGRTLL
jgi:PEP-CTERM motif